MGNIEWRSERDELLQVLEDLASGRIILEQGQDEYVSILKRRIAYLEGRPAPPGSDNVSIA